MLQLKRSHEIPFTSALALARHHRIPELAYATQVETQQLLGRPHTPPPNHTPPPRQAEGRWWNAAKWLLLLLMFGIAIGIIVVLWHTADRVERVLGLMSMGESLEEFHSMISTMARGARNVEAATSNVEAASRLGLTAAAEAVPALQKSMNTTLGLVDKLNSFSSHPHVQLSV